MPRASTVAVVREFWRLMQSNDFHSVAAVLASEFVLEWPQSKERIRGAERFARMKTLEPLFQDSSSNARLAVGFR